MYSKAPWRATSALFLKGFPKKIYLETVVQEDGYSEYRRRNNGPMLTTPSSTCTSIFTGVRTGPFSTFRVRMRYSSISTAVTLVPPRPFGAFSSFRPIESIRRCWLPPALHLSNQQTVTFQEGASHEDLAERLKSSVTTLTAFFQYNSEHDTGRHLLYQDFPGSFVWKADRKGWSLRQRGTAIGRMYFCSPRQRVVLEKLWPCGS